MPIEKLPGVGKVTAEKLRRQTIRLEHTYYSIEELIETDERGETSTKIRTKIIPKLELSEFSDKEIFHAITIVHHKRKFLIGLNGPRRRFLHSLFENEEIFPCGNIPTQFVSFDELADEWDKIALTEHEEHVKTALRFIEPDFESLAFIKSDKRHLKKLNLK